MNDKTIHPLTQNVLDTFADCTDPRLKQIMTALVTHLHAFASEVELTGDEWRRGIEFLTATGKMCNGIRQEFILLSDTLGLSIMIDAINHGRGGVTELYAGPVQIARRQRVPNQLDLASGHGEGRDAPVASRPS